MKFEELSPEKEEELLKRVGIVFDDTMKLTKHACSRQEIVKEVVGKGIVTNLIEAIMAGMMIAFMYEQHHKKHVMEHVKQLILKAKTEQEFNTTQAIKN